MKNKTIKNPFLPFLVLLCALFSLHAADYSYTDSTADHNWNTPANWSPQSVPSSSDRAFFDIDYQLSGKYCLIEEGDDITVGRLMMSTADGNTGHTYIRMTGGTLTATEGISLGDYHFYDDSFYAARFEQLGGDVVCDDFWRVGYRTGLSEWYLREGTVTCGRLLVQTDAATYSRIIIENGSFSVKYDRVEQMQQLFGSAIFPYNDQGTLKAIFDPSARGGLGETIVKRIVRPSSPVPASGESGVAADITLRWQSGSEAVSSDLYISTDYEAVVHAEKNEPAYYDSFTTQSCQLPTLRLGATYYWRVDDVQTDGSIVRGFTWEFTVDGQIPVSAANASSKYADIREPTFAVDGSGLTGNSHISQTNYNMWQDYEISEFPKWFRVDLGSSRFAEQLKIWNYNWSGYTDRGVKNLDILTADGVTDPGNPIDDSQKWTLARSGVVVAQAPGTDDYNTPDIIDISGVQCRWIALRINSSWGGGYGGLSEVQVDGQALACSGSPMPSDGFQGVNVDIMLQWQNGEGLIDSQVVYLGTDYQQVLNASDPYSPPSQGIYTADRFTPASLDYDTDYYWRIDQVFCDGSVAAGPLWHFKTASLPSLAEKAFKPLPAVGGYLGIYDRLEWAPADLAESYEIYLGENYSDVYNADDPMSYPGLGSLSENSFRPQPLDYGKQYYWRVDTRNTCGVTRGDVWQFSTYPPPASLDEYYVALGGNDSAPGTKKQPFATLHRARDAVRYARSLNPNRNITVWLESGRYTLTRPLELDINDGGTGPYRVTYSSAPGHIASIDSDVSIENWQPLPVSGQPAGLPAAAQGKLWVADIPSRAGDFKTLYAGTDELPRAQAPGFVPLDVNDDLKSKTRLYCPPGVLSDWENIDDVELIIRADVPYSMQILPVRSVDVDSNVLTTLYPATYYLLPLRRTDQPVVDQSAWIENVPQGMTEPGRWFTDTAKGKVYLWPLDDDVPQSITAPALCNYISIAGDQAAAAAVRNITIRRLSFRRSDRYAVVGDEYSEKVQHGWDFYDANNAVVRFRWASGCKVERCEFDGGASGVRLDQYARMIEVSGCNMENIGGTGVFICGPDDSRQINQYNKIYNNRIIGPGEKYWNGHGVLIYQSQSNLVKQNLVADTPYTAITVTGSTDITTSHNNLIEGNEVYNTCTMLGDGNGIYLRYAGLGNIVRGNYIHHIYAPGSHGGIRCDDFQANVTLENNIIYKCAYTGIIIKEYNIVRNNIIYDLYQPGDPLFDWNIEPKGFLLLRPHTTCNDAVISNNIFCNSGPAVNFYEDESNKLSTCVVDDNIFYTLGDPDFTAGYLAALQSAGIDTHSIAADPLFSDTDKFELGAASPAFTLGFQAVDIDDMSLRSFCDLNRDMIVDNEDFAIFADCWMQADMRADIAPLAGDKILNIDDIIMLTDHWMD